jgi:hypothetical protein
VSGTTVVRSDEAAERPGLVRAAKYAIGGMSFGAKGLIAFAINYLLANCLATGDFARWSSIFSLAMVLSVADFGIGQLVLTTVHETRARGAERGRLLANAVAAMVAVSICLLATAGAAVALLGLLAGIRWKFVLVAVILLRLPFIPFGAVLAAEDRFHERKVAEATSYAVGGALVAAGVAFGAGVSTLLLAMNAAITAGAMALRFRAGDCGLAKAGLHSVSTHEVGRLLRRALPYFVNNASGLVIYGGFIGLASLVLTAGETAKLSILHNLVFMYLFQVADLVFRTSQTRLDDGSVRRRLAWFLAVSSAVGLAVAGLAGAWLLGRLFPRYQYGSLELLVYVAFVHLELLYLMLTARMQMKSSCRRSLQAMSLRKAAGFAAVLGVAALWGHRYGLTGFLALLLGYSAVMTCWMRASLGRAVVEVEA